MNDSGPAWTRGEELEVRRSLVWALTWPAAVVLLAAGAEAAHVTLLGNGAAGSGDTPYQALTCPPASATAMPGYAGPSRLIVDSPQPARTTTMSAGSAEGLLSRCTAPLGT